MERMTWTNLTKKLARDAIGKGKVFANFPDNQKGEWITILRVDDDEFDYRYGSDASVGYGVNRWTNKLRRDDKTVVDGGYQIKVWFNCPTQTMAGGKKRKKRRSIKKRSIKKRKSTRKRKKRGGNGDSITLTKTDFIDPNKMYTGREYEAANQAWSRYVRDLYHKRKKNRSNGRVQPKV